MRKTALTQASAWRAAANSSASFLALLADVGSRSKSDRRAHERLGDVCVASGGERLAIVIDRGSGSCSGSMPNRSVLTLRRGLDPAAPAVTAETAVLAVELLGGRDYRRGMSHASQSDESRRCAGSINWCNLMGCDLFRRPPRQVRPDHCVGECGHRRRRTQVDQPAAV